MLDCKLYCMKYVMTAEKLASKFGSTAAMIIVLEYTYEILIFKGKIFTSTPTPSLLNNIYPTCK